MIVAKHVTDGKLVLAIIDSDLAGKSFEEGKRQLDLKNKFYQGEELSNAETSALLNKANIIHAVGEETISFLEKEGFSVNEGILRVSGIPFIQLMSG